MTELNPDEYTVDELEAVVADFDDAESLQILLEAEAGGKDRKTAKAAIERRLEAVGQMDDDAPMQDADDPSGPEDSVDQQDGADADRTDDGSAASSGSSVETSDTEETVQVLTFTLNEETYCVDIDHVTEIVEAGDVTAIPNAPAHVEGMMDLRGNTTTIIDPRGPLGVERDVRRDGVPSQDQTQNDEYEIETAAEDTDEVEDETGGADRIVVFDPTGFDHGSATGWMVDQVHNVVRISSSDVDAGPTDDDGVTGVVKRDGDFLIWVSPESLVG